MSLTPEQIDAIKRMEHPDPEMMEILRQKTPAELYAIACGMWRSARDMIRNLIRAEHPDWDENAVHREAARRLSHGAF